jgi:hypothetical protein
MMSKEERRITGVILRMLGIIGWFLQLVSFFPSQVAGVKNSKYDADGGFSANCSLYVFCQVRYRL